MNVFAQAEHQYLTPPEPAENYDHTDVVCPPNPSAICNRCGDELGSHIRVDDPDAPLTPANAGCICDAQDAFWAARPIRLFVLAAGDSLDCPDVDRCITCDVDLCMEHSSEFTTCVDGGLHHDDCAMDCPACDAGRAEDAAHERGDAIRKGEW